MLWKAAVLSNFGQFLLLPSLIWDDTHRETHLFFVSVYCIISQAQAFSGKNVENLI